MQGSPTGSIERWYEHSEEVYHRQQGAIEEPGQRLPEAKKTAEGAYGLVGYTQSVAASANHKARTKAVNYPVYIDNLLLGSSKL